MEKILSSVGLLSISLFLLYIIKKVDDYFHYKSGENITITFEEDDEI